jgi:hypothetical protein
LKLSRRAAASKVRNAVSGSRMRAEPMLSPFHDNSFLYASASSFSFVNQ